ncbi:MAG: CPBP family intramembrane metalloprotease [Spirochaetia bacterium]|nr:CPBP family intramembrane metalloprotease [Spirochaetia bacterium]
MKSDLSSGFLWCAGFLGISALVSWMILQAIRPASENLWLIAIPSVSGAIVTSFFYYLARKKLPWTIENASGLDLRSALGIPAVGLGLFALGQTSPEPAWPMRDGIDLIAAFISMVVLGPVSEEIFFRGLLLNEMRRTNFSIWAGAALFAVSHLNPGVLLFAFASGLVLGKVVQWSGTVLAPILIHSISNFLTVLTWSGWLVPPGAMAIAALVLAGSCGLLVLRRT